MQIQEALVLQTGYALRPEDGPTTAKNLLDSLTIDLGKFWLIIYPTIGLPWSDSAPS